jgi:hypothetical protein
MVFKIWEQETSDEREYDPNFPIDRDLGFRWRQSLFRGKFTPLSELPILSFEATQDTNENDFFEGEGIPIVSDKIRGIFMLEMPEAAIFFPVKILSKGKEIGSKKFYIIKINNEIQCFDWDKSEYEVRLLNNGEKRISAIRKLVLTNDNIKDQAIFKIAEVTYFLVAVRNDICEKILSAGAKGIEFIEFNEVLR